MDRHTLAAPLPPYNDFAPSPMAVSARAAPPSPQDIASALDALKVFLATAPTRWNTHPQPAQPFQHGNMRRLQLPNQDFVSCVLWNGRHFITGTDIVRALLLRFEAFGRPVRNMKKFEEGVFSDLRNLKPNQDACLEEPKSPFLDLLFKYQCIRTQKKQKVFYWYSVPHDRLFLDALERDLKREKMGQESTTLVAAEPAASFAYDQKRSLYEQFGKTESLPQTLPTGPSIYQHLLLSSALPTGGSKKRTFDDFEAGGSSAAPAVSAADRPNTLRSFTMFEGSPSYKQRRKKVPGDGSNLVSDVLLSRSLTVPSHSFNSVNSAPIAAPVVPSSSMLPAPLVVPAQMPPFAPLLSQQHHHQIQQPLLHNVYLHQHHSSPSLLGQQAPIVPDQDYHITPSPPMSSSGLSFTLSGQMPIHPMSKSYHCPLEMCARQFKRQEHLKRHLRTHTMEKPYECGLCGKKFSRSDNLSQHLRTHGRGPLSSDGSPSGDMDPLEPTATGSSGGYDLSDEDLDAMYSAGEFDGTPGQGPLMPLHEHHGATNVFGFDTATTSTTTGGTMWETQRMPEIYVGQPAPHQHQVLQPGHWASPLEIGSPSYSDDSSASSHHANSPHGFPSPAGSGHLHMGAGSVGDVNTPATTVFPSPECSPNGPSYLPRTMHHGHHHGPGADVYLSQVGSQPHTPPHGTYPLGYSAPAERLTFDGLHHHQQHQQQQQQQQTFYSDERGYASDGGQYVAPQQRLVPTYM